MESLAIDILDLVFRILDVKSLVQSMVVCQHWKNCGKNWRLWQAFYFKRWPRFKDDVTYKKAVDQDWLRLYIRLHTYSRDVFCLHTVDISEKVRSYLEETLISPYVINKSTLITSTRSGRFYSIYETIKNNEAKNDQFVPFLHDYSVLSIFNGLEEQFMPVLIDAKAKKKKVLLLINDFDDGPAGINPIISHSPRRAEIMNILARYRDDIVMLLHSCGPEHITEPWIRLLVAWQVNLVHVQLPEKSVRKKIIQELVNVVREQDKDSFHSEIDCDLIAEKTAGANEDEIRQLIRTAMYAVLRLAVEAQTNDTDPIHAYMNTDDVLKQLPTIHSQQDLTKPIHSSDWDAFNVRALKRIVDENPTLKIIDL